MTGLAALARRALITGNVAGLCALAVAIPAARLERGRPSAAVSPIGHIWTGHPPLVHAVCPTPRMTLAGCRPH